MRQPLILSQTAVPFVAPFDDDWVVADAQGVGRTFVVVAEYQIRSVNGRNEDEFSWKTVPDWLNAYFLIFIFGHLQSRSLVNTKRETFSRFAKPLTTLSSVFRKIAFTWSVNFTDSDLLWSSMDLVVDGTASRAMTRAMIARMRTDGGGNKARVKVN